MQFAEQVDPKIFPRGLKPEEHKVYAAGMKSRPLKVHASVRAELVLLFFVLSAPMSMAQAGPGVCFRSQQDAVRGGQVSETRDTGYRLQSVRWDSLLGRRWVTIASCDHPERPAVTLAVDGVPSAAGVMKDDRGAARSAAASLVRAGDPVRIFLKEELLQLEFSGIAQGNGNPGDQIRVRISYAASEDRAADRYVLAVVRGPRLLEMQP